MLVKCKKWCLILIHSSLLNLTKDKSSSDSSKFQRFFPPTKVIFETVRPDLTRRVFWAWALLIFKINTTSLSDNMFGHLEYEGSCGDRFWNVKPAASESDWEGDGNSKDAWELFRDEILLCSVNVTHAFQKEALLVISWTNRMKVEIWGWFLGIFW